jgi:hypothetical protein
MRISKWLRLAAGATTPFWLGHTAAVVLSPSRGSEEQAVYAMMKHYSFDAFGIQRSHWDFYQGYGVFMSVTVLLVIVWLWQLAPVAEKDPIVARPLLISTAVGLLAFAAVNAVWFMIPPAICSAVAGFLVLKATFQTQSSRR